MDITSTIADQLEGRTFFHLSLKVHFKGPFPAKAVGEQSAHAMRIKERTMFEKRSLSFVLHKRTGTYLLYHEPLDALEGGPERRRCYPDNLHLGICVQEFAFKSEYAFQELFKERA